MNLKEYDENNIGKNLEKLETKRKEHYAIIEAQQATINGLNIKISSLESRIALLENR